MLQKFKLTVSRLHGDKTPREYDHFDYGMIQSIENVTKCKHTQGILREITSDWWEFQYSFANSEAQPTSLLVLERITPDSAPTPCVRQIAKPRFR